MHTVLYAIQPCVFAVITFLLNDLREHLGLHNGFTEGMIKKKYSLNQSSLFQTKVLKISAYRYSSTVHFLVVDTFVYNVIKALTCCQN